MLSFRWPCNWTRIPSQSLRWTLAPTARGFGSAQDLKVPSSTCHCARLPREKKAKQKAWPEATSQPRQQSSSTHSLHLQVQKSSNSRGCDVNIIRIRPATASPTLRLHCKVHKRAFPSHPVGHVLRLRFQQSLERCCKTPFGLECWTVPR